MKIAVIGPGAMGLLYGGKLSAAANTILVGNNPVNIDAINQNGVTIIREENPETYPVPAKCSGEATESMDLILLFTKAYLTEEALRANQAMIGKDTMILTLQNGKGHEDILQKFTDAAHILIGTTAQGSSRKDGHTIIHSGLGETVIGSMNRDLFASDSAFRRRAEEIAAVFEQAGFPCSLSENITYTVWNKLMINASSSVLSGILQKHQGYVIENPWAWLICKDLIKEICDTAEGEGCHFDYEEQVNRIYHHLKQARGGFTSIYSDLKNGRKTEVDTISGAVVSAARKQGKQVPVQETMVRLVHVLEQEK